MIAIALVVMVAIGGTATFAAENSVPGDMLYGYKTSVNESVRGALAVSTEAEANWNVRKAERRLEEATELKARGELNADVAAELGAEFASHAEAALQGASELNAEGKADAAAEIITRIDAVIQAGESVDATVSSDTSAGARISLKGIVEQMGAYIKTSGGNTDVQVTSDAESDTSVRVEGATIKSGTSAESSNGADASASSNTKIESSTNVRLEL